MNEVVIVGGGAQPDRPPQRRAVGPASGRSARRVQRAAIERGGVDPAAVGQIVGGCVSQVGEQSFNIARTAWLAQGLPLEVAATTVDSQCGSSQQATTLAPALIGAGIEDLVLACGVEMMTRVPLGANMKGGSPLPTELRVALRVRVAVPGRGDDRQGVRHYARGHRPLRPAQPDAGRSRPGRKAASTARWCRSRRRRWTPRASRPARRRRCRATRACARRRWKSSPR